MTWRTRKVKVTTEGTCFDPRAQEPSGDGYKPQQYPLPKEEDLNNWSHHALETCGDESAEGLCGDGTTSRSCLACTSEEIKLQAPFNGVSRDPARGVARSARLYLKGIVSKFDNLTHWLISTQACTRTGT